MHCMHAGQSNNAMGKRDDRSTHKAKGLLRTSTAPMQTLMFGSVARSTRKPSAASRCGSTTSDCVMRRMAACKAVIPAVRACVARQHIKSGQSGTCLCICVAVVKRRKCCGRNEAIHNCRKRTPRKGAWSGCVRLRQQCPTSIVLFCAPEIRCATCAARVDLHTRCVSMQK